MFKKKTQQLLPEKQTNAKNSTEMFVKMINAFIKVRNEMIPLTFDSCSPLYFKILEKICDGETEKILPGQINIEKMEV